MTTAILRSALLAAVVAVGVTFNTSCSVDQQAAFETGNGGSKTKKTTVSTEKETWSERREAAKAEREKAKAEAEKQKAKELAEKKATERKEEARKEAEEAREKELAARKDKEEEKRKAAEEKAREEAIAAKKKEKEEAKAAKIAAREKAKKEREEREAREEVAENNSSRSSRGGFSLLGGGGNSAKYRGSGHNIYVNKHLIGSLNPSNAKIEIDLSEQRARVFRNAGGTKDLVIETNVSTGKSGYSTGTGTFRIKEKLVAKRSTRYGQWLNSSGGVVRADGDSNYRPSGATRFVGASMPYWMRVNGGIGMHIGYVPNYPASHGCIRVPEEIQPLIFSKVGVGTSVTIHH